MNRMDSATDHDLLGFVSDSVVVTDREGTVLYTNPAAGALLHLRPGDELEPGLARFAQTPGHGVTTHRHHDRILRLELDAHHLTWDKQPAAVLIVRDVTPFKAGGDRLQSYPQTDQPLPEGIFDCSLDGVVRSWNQATGKIFGVDEESAVGCKLENVIAAEGHAQTKLEELRDAARYGTQPYTAALELQLPGDGSRSVQITVQPALDAAGDICHLLVLARPLERAFKEAPAVSGKTEYQRLFETMEQGVVYQDTESRVTAVNPAAERILGLRADEIVGRRCNATGWGVPVIREDGTSLAENEHPAATVIRTGRAVHDLVLGIENQRDHCWRWITVDALPRFDSATSVFWGVYTIFNDITALRSVQKQLAAALEDARRKETYFRRIFYQTSAGAAIVSMDYRFERVNRKLCHICGYTEQEMLSMTMTDLVHPQDVNADIQDAARLIKRQIDHFERNERLVRKDGSLAWVHVSVGLVRDSSGEPVHFLTMVTDITQRVKSEQARRKMAAQLMQAQKLESIGTLAGGVAHEINNPINGIMNYAQLIKDQIGDRDDMLAEFSTEIITETERIAVLVRNLLAFARQEKQGHSPARLCDIVQETLSLIQTVIRHDQISLQVNVPDDLPLVLCRSQQIEQVLMNLLTNARDSLNAKYPDCDANKIIRITASVHSTRPSIYERTIAGTTESDSQSEETGEKGGAPASGHMVRVTVEDRGQGIPTKTRERIFDPFYTTKPRDKGTGLGLSISHGIVEDHRGRLTVASKPGEWTRFHVDLPTAQESPDTET
mgnify:CR=1 FL=1